MSRWEFMRRLEELLFDISPNEREEALQYYNDYFNDAGKENEQDVIKALGSPEQVAKIVRDGLGDGSIQGEFTENGFSSGRPEAQNELIKREAVGGSARQDSTQTENGSGSFGQNAGDFVQGTVGAGRSSGSFGQGVTGAGQNTGSFGQSAGGFEQAAGAGQNSEAYENGYRQDSGSFTQAGAAGKSRFQKEKKDMPVWAIVLIVLACIICSPVILGLACGLLGVIVGLAAAVAGVVFGVGLAAVVLFVVAVALVIAGLGVILSRPFTGIGLLGGGFLCASLGILFMLLTILMVTKVIPAICRGIVSIYNSICKKKGGAAA
ncbi:MAG: DUF1700 domain-containing protein [Clostridium sp.]|nr:DUF1700 domain-containing protein [Clostridium sp.]